MIRKAIIVVLTLVAVGTLAVWFAMELSTAGLSIRLQQPWAWGYSDQSVLLGRYNAGDPAAIIPRARTSPNFLGFGIVRQSLGGMSVTGVLLPYWSIAVLSATYPAVAFIRGPLRRWRRRRKDLCLKCGYDLRGTPERCPECGDTR